MGEISRLWDVPENQAASYGPLGKNWCVHVDIPESVIAAYKRLQPVLESYEKMRQVRHADQARTEDGLPLSPKEKSILTNLLAKYQNAITTAERITITAWIINLLREKGHSRIADMLGSAKVVRGPPELFAEFENNEIPSI